MYENGNEKGELPDSVRRILNDLPRERMPAPHLENRIAAELRDFRLIGHPGAVARRTGSGRRRIEVAWPVAAAAAALVFLSGMAVGSAARPVERAGQKPVATAQTQSAAPLTGVLLFTTDSTRRVRRAVWY